MVQFYRDMGKKRSHILAPLTKLVGVGKKKLKWTEIYQKAFEDIKKGMAHETILNYPNLHEVFEICTDASDSQLGQQSHKMEGPYPSIVGC